MKLGFLSAIQVNLESLFIVQQIEKNGTQYYYISNGNAKKFQMIDDRGISRCIFSQTSKMESFTAKANGKKN